MMGYKTTDEAWNAWTASETKQHYVSIWRLEDGSFEGFPSNVEAPAGAVRLAPQPKRPSSRNPHEGTQNAMKKHLSLHPKEIAWGCYYAVKIAREKRTVTSREVTEKLIDAEVVEPGHRLFWIGTVFHKLKAEKILLDTGKSTSYSDASRGVHERTIKVWELAPDVVDTAYDNEPKERP